MAETIKRSVAKYAYESKRDAIAAYMFEHPEETRRYVIGQAIGVNRQTVGKYYDEIRKEIEADL